jgi:plastocyanin
MRLRLKAGFLVPAAGLAAALVLAACGAGETEGNTDVSNSGPGIDVTAPAVVMLSSATPAVTRSPNPGGAAAASSAAQQVTIIGRDNTFDKREITIQANSSVGLTFQNQGSAIHNWEVIGQKDKDGQTIKTELLTGGKSETIVFTIDKTGTFDYYCQVHPVEMRGKLIVR